jgi:hypothetical protein
MSVDETEIVPCAARADEEVHVISRTHVGVGSLSRDWTVHAQEMQQRLSLPQQQAVAAGFDEFVSSGADCEHHVR